MTTKIQRCSLCDSPTGRCEDDTIQCRDSGPLCEACYVDTYHEFVADAIAELRSTILHGLEHFDNYQTNVVLGLIDDILGEFM